MAKIAEIIITIIKAGKFDLFFSWDAANTTDQFFFSFHINIQIKNPPL
jgi:hypothetical protein